MWEDIRAEGAFHSLLLGCVWVFGLFVYYSVYCISIACHTQQRKRRLHSNSYFAVGRPSLSHARASECIDSQPNYSITAGTANVFVSTLTTNVYLDNDVSSRKREDSAS